LGCGKEGIRGFPPQPGVEGSNRNDCQAGREEHVSDLRTPTAGCCRGISETRSKILPALVTAVQRRQAVLKSNRTSNRQTAYPPRTRRQRAVIRSWLGWSTTPEQDAITHWKEVSAKLGKISEELHFLACRLVASSVDPIAGEQTPLTSLTLNIPR
jgi:hypothetical protein